MKINNFFSDIDELLDSIATMQKLQIKTDTDELDRVINELSVNEISQTDLEWVAAAGKITEVPDWIKNNKNM